MTSPSPLTFGEHYIHSPSGLVVRALDYGFRGKIKIRWPLGGESEVPRGHLAERKGEQDE